MSGLIGSILSTTNALKANQTAIETAGRNMANVNSPSYSRQRVEFGISGGISESTISQQRDVIIESKILRESSVSGSLDAQTKVLEQIQIIFGEQITGDVSSPDTLEGSTSGDSDSFGLSGALSDFFNAMHALSSDPDDVPAKAAVIAQAEELVNRFNTIAGDLESLDQDVVRNIDADVIRVNSLLDEIANINGEISKIEIQDPGSAHEFRDLRQQKLQDLSKYIDFETEEIANGQVRVAVRDKDASGGNEVLLVDRTNTPNKIKFNESSNELYFSGYTSLPLGNSPNSTAFAIEGGTLHGYIEVRSTTDPYGASTSYGVGSLAKLQEDLDTLARELATQVSGIYDVPGNNEFFFDDDSNADAVDLSLITAKNIQLYQGNGTTIPGLSSATLKSTNSATSGSNDIAIAIAELSEYTSSNLRGNNFTGFVSELATELGNDISNTKALAENQELILSQLKDQRAAVSGVSIDEELANIIRFQRSFEASARVLQVMDEMLEIITNGLVR